MDVYKRIYSSESRCGICHLPWSACGTECIDITDELGVFYVCPHCWKNSDLQTIFKATAQGHLSQFYSCATDEDKTYFLKMYKLIDILIKTEQKYILTHKDTKREQECELILKAGNREFKLDVFQSPKGLRDRDKRPDTVMIDCHQEYNQVQLLRFAAYLQDVARSMSYEKSI